MLLQLAAAFFGFNTLVIFIHNIPLAIIYLLLGSWWFYLQCPLRTKKLNYKAVVDSILKDQIALAGYVFPPVLFTLYYQDFALLLAALIADLVIYQLYQKR